MYPFRTRFPPYSCFQMILLALVITGISFPKCFCNEKFTTQQQTITNPVESHYQISIAFDSSKFLTVYLLFSPLCLLMKSKKISSYLGICSVWKLWNLWSFMKFYLWNAVSHPWAKLRDVKQHFKKIRENWKNSRRPKLIDLICVKNFQSF